MKINRNLVNHEIQVILLDIRFVAEIINQLL